MPELSESEKPIHPVFAVETLAGARTHHKTVRSTIAAAVGSVLRFSNKYAYYSRLGYTREAARRKALWHIR